MLAIVVVIIIAGGGAGSRRRRLQWRTKDSTVGNERALQ